LFKITYFWFFTKSWIENLIVEILRFAQYDMIGSPWGSCHQVTEVVIKVISNSDW